jgi:FixJ family two-component response regulator
MMPQVSGMDLLRLIKDRCPDVGVVMITGYASIPTAVRAIRLGAIEYVPKPFTPEELSDVTERALEKVIEQARKRIEAKKRAEAEAVSSKIDEDLPFDEKALEASTSASYVEHLSRSDMPYADVHASKTFCPIGLMNCRKYENSGACKGECPILAKREKEAAAAQKTEEDVIATIGKGYIDVDLPFDAYELAMATSPEYVECLSRSGMPLAARWRKVEVEAKREEHHVLVVDDETVVCNSVRKILSGKGFRVDQALDPEEALRKIDLEQYDLVILDFKLPRMTGLQLLHRIKAVYPDLAVIMITGYASIPGAIEATKEGAFEYLAKPFTPGELLTAARGALELQAA